MSYYILTLKRHRQTSRERVLRIKKRGESGKQNERVREGKREIERERERENKSIRDTKRDREEKERDKRE